MQRTYFEEEVFDVHGDRDGDAGCFQPVNVFCTDGNLQQGFLCDHVVHVRCDRKLARAIGSGRRDLDAAHR